MSHDIERQLDGASGAQPTEGEVGLDTPVLVEASVVEAVEDESPHRLVRLRTLAPFTHRPAQVVSARVGLAEPSWFAIASPPGASHLELLIRRSDPEAPMDRVMPGDNVTLHGPFGAGFGLARASRHVLAGVGSAWGALRSAARTLIDAGVPPAHLAIALGVRRPSELPDRSTLLSLAAAGAEVVLAFSRDLPVGAIGAGVHAVAGRVPYAIEALSPLHAESARACIAGSDEAEAACVAALLARGVPFDHIERNYHPDHRAGVRPGGAPPAGIEPAQDKD